MTVHEIDRLPRVGPAALCMGVFDGVHRGHRALLELTRRVAAERGLASVALLFDPPPLEVIRPDQRVPRLAPVAENLRRLGAAGIDAPLALRFTAELRELPPEAFLAALASAIELRVLLMTPDSAFGRSRAGTPQAMRAHGADAGFEVVMLDELLETDGAQISSSRIRDLIAAGEIDDATDLLGWPPYLAGTTRGGRLAFDYHPALPGDGRYAARRRSPAGTVELEASDGSVAVRPAPGDGDAIELDLERRIGDGA